jgi:hypothetical protein
MFLYQYLMKIDNRFRLEKTTWQDRLNEMSWRDGFTESMFNRFQCIIDFVCTQLHSKKTTKKNIDEVGFHRFKSYFEFRPLFFFRNWQFYNT